MHALTLYRAGVFPYAWRAGCSCGWASPGYADRRDALSEHKRHRATHANGYEHP